MIDRAALKAAVRQRMAGASPPCWQIMLVWFLAASLAPSILSALAPSPLTNYLLLVEQGIDPYMALGVFSGGSAMLGLFLTIVLSCYRVILNFGVSNYSLRLYQGKPCQQSDLFAGFAMVLKVILTQVLVTLFVSMWATLLLIPLFGMIAICVMMFGGIYGLSTLGTISIIATYVVYLFAVIAVTIRYDLAVFVLADNPSLNPFHAIQRSKELMQGNRWDYLFLLLSFAGWMILCSVLALVLTALIALAGSPLTVDFLPGGANGMLTTFLLSDWVNLPLAVAGLPVTLWLTPYLNTARAGFYEILKTDNLRFEPLDEHPYF